ncbi:hypothetical protein SSP24_10620 [Streptomyces spinoverrucosus]|uniref:Transposase IS116/IS110/IS902 C-terminal domain-containing protein n=1 Tax=Streptomyces spinoverrucosus TaxID=284043 RepID=A0A4Y3V8U2_9ACTN|nr:hypothetical protein SSP24_10620 [Streptomyces spinoverrucosus]GHB35905.1 hypothetical protein GCM10010397_01950 [Streptomyces spinoverrucosus]
MPGEKRAAKLVCDLAHQLLALDEWIKDTDREIREVFRLDERAEVIESLPGMGGILGAEFLAIVGDLSGYADAGRLAAHAGLAPVSRDSGRRTGNHHRPKRYHRRLRHIFYMAAQTAMMRPGPSRDYYLKKRAEGLIHTQALPPSLRLTRPGRGAGRVRQNAEPTRLLCLWIETSNTSLNGTGALCVADSGPVTRSVARLKDLSSSKGT